MVINKVGGMKKKNYPTIKLIEPDESSHITLRSVARCLLRSALSWQMSVAAKDVAGQHFYMHTWIGDDRIEQFDGYFSVMKMRFFK